MEREERLKVYQDAKKEIQILNQGELVDFCFYGNPFSNGFVVERMQDDDLGELFDVNGYLMRSIPEITAMTFRHIMS